MTNRLVNQSQLPTFKNCKITLTNKQTDIKLLRKEF